MKPYWIPLLVFALSAINANAQTPGRHGPNPRGSGKGGCERGLSGVINLCNEPQPGNRPASKRSAGKRARAADDPSCLAVVCGAGEGVLTTCTSSAARMSRRGR